MRISDWSSDVCASDLSLWPADQEALADQIGAVDRRDHEFGDVGEADPRRHEAGAMAIAVHAFAHQRGLGKEGLQIVHEKHGAEYNRRRAVGYEMIFERQHTVISRFTARLIGCPHG